MEKKLSRIIGEMIEDEVERILEKELKNPNYLNQELYTSCRERVEAAMAEVVKRPTDFLILSIATHREEKHSEDHSIEINKVSKDLSKEDQRLARTSRFWLA